MALTRITKGVIKPNENYDTHNINSTGIVTAIGLDVNGSGDISGNLSVGGVLTYEDVTSIDSVGIITAQSDIHVGAGISVVGVGSFGSLDISGDIDVDGHTNLDNVSIAGVTTTSAGVNIGGDLVLPSSGHNLKIWTGGSQGIILGHGGTFGELDNLTGTMVIKAGKVKLLNRFGNLDMLTCNAFGSVDLFHNNILRFTTTGYGVSTTGLEVVGVSTFTGAIDANGDLDVDGHTNLDNVSVAGVTTTSDTIFIKADNKYLSIGAHNDGDMLLYHDGNKSVLVNYTGDFHIRTNNGSRSSLEGIILKPNGATEIYHSGSKIIETTSSGAKVNGDFLPTSSDTYDLGSNSLKWSQLHLKHYLYMPDDGRIRFGASYDMQLWHDGTAQILLGKTGDTVVTCPSGQSIRLNKSSADNYNAESMLRAYADGAVELYHNGTKQVETISSGVLLPDRSTNTGRLAFGDLGTRIEGGAGGGSSTGLFFMTNSGFKWQISGDGHLLPNTAGAVNIGSASAEIGNVFLADSRKVFLGSDQDYSIYHDGTHGHLTNTTGNLFVTNSGTNYTYVDSNFFRVRDSSGNHMFDVNSGGGYQGVGLYYSAGSQGTEKLRTSATGITVTGEVATSQDYPNFRPTLDLNFAAEKKLDPRITYQRTGPASFTNEFGKVVLVGDNVPRFDHDPITRECKGLLIEESRTNHLLYSEMLENWSFGVGTDVFTASSGSQLSANPDGSSPAYHYVPSSTSGHHRHNRYITVPTLNTNYVVSLFVKRVTAGSVSNLNRYIELEVTGNFNGNSPGTGQSGGNGGSHVVYDLQNLTIHNGQSNNTSGFVGDSKLEAYPNDWYRLSYVFNPGIGSNSTGQVWWGHPSTSAGDAGNEQGNGNPSFYFWGASVEKGSFLSSYIPTSSAAVTRGDDDLIIDGEDLTDFHNQPEGTIIADYKVIAGDPEIFYLSNNTASRRIGLYEAGSSQTRFIIGNSGTQADTTDSAGTTVGDNIKAAGAYKLNDVAASKNGVISSTDTSVTIPDGIDRAYIGGYYNGDVQGILGLRRLVYYQQRLPNSQLVTLTA